MIYTEFKNKSISLFKEKYLISEHNNVMLTDFWILGKSKYDFHLNIQLIDEIDPYSNCAVKIKYHLNENQLIYSIGEDYFNLMYSVPEKSKVVLTNDLMENDKIFDEGSNERFSTEILISTKINQNILLHSTNITYLQSYLKEFKEYYKKRVLDLDIDIRDIPFDVVNIPLNVLYKLCEHGKS